MKSLKKLIFIALALVLAMSLIACDEDKVKDNGADTNKTAGVGNADTSKGGSKKELDISQDIKNAMNANNALSGFNYFLAPDGSILVMGDSSDEGFADFYATLSNVEKISGNALAPFALTENGDLYYENSVIASEINSVGYCTTNTNMQGFCINDKDVLWITNDRKIFELPQTSKFVDMTTEEKLSGTPATIESDKHDFFVVTTEGKLYAKLNDTEQFKDLDLTGFDNLVLVDLAKHMDQFDVESLTLAGLKADGSVVATGTYADDILSWGKLSYLTMSDGMIVGLTPDGKLKMTGDYAEKMKGFVEAWENITSVEVGYANGNNIGYIITAVDKDGTFYYTSLTQERSGADAGSASLENGAVGGRFWYKYAPDGKVYFSDNGEWIEE